MLAHALVCFALVSVSVSAGPPPRVIRVGEDNPFRGPSCGIHARHFQRRLRLGPNAFINAGSKIALSFNGLVLDPEAPPIIVGGMVRKRGGGGSKTIKYIKALWKLIHRLVQVSFCIAGRNRIAALQRSYSPPVVNGRWFIDVGCPVTRMHIEFSGLRDRIRIIPINDGERGRPFIWSPRRRMGGRKREENDDEQNALSSVQVFDDVEADEDDALVPRGGGGGGKFKELVRKRANRRLTIRARVGYEFDTIIIRILPPLEFFLGFGGKVGIDKRSVEAAEIVEEQLAEDASEIAQATGDDIDFAVDEDGDVDLDAVLFRVDQEFGELPEPVQKGEDKNRMSAKDVSDLAEEYGIDAGEVERKVSGMLKARGPGGPRPLFTTSFCITSVSIPCSEHDDCSDISTESEE